MSELKTCVSCKWYRNLPSAFDWERNCIHPECLTPSNIDVVTGRELGKKGQPCWRMRGVAEPMGPKTKCVEFSLERPRCGRSAQFWEPAPPPKDIKAEEIVEPWYWRWIGRFFKIIAICIIAIVSVASAFRLVRAETGIASWYGFESGNRTANGERFNPHGMTAAHRTHRFGTRLRVTDHRTGRSVVCRVNDRGPAKWTGRVIDLSRGCAAALGIIGRGTAPVTVEVAHD